MGFHMKVHENAKGRVVAICDSELMGKTFAGREGVLDLKAYAAFYGSAASEKEVLEQLKNFTSLNLVGSGAVGLAARLKLVGKSQILEIGGVPHAQVYKI